MALGDALFGGMRGLWRSSLLASCFAFGDAMVIGSYNVCVFLCESF